jgi:ubiquitin C-terminal hydrolase
MISGLENLGNTCYLNSVLQLLMQCSSFIDIFKEAEKMNPKGSSPIIQNFIDFILKYESKKIVSPVEIQKILNSSKNLFEPFQQYDAHESLIQLLDILGEETEKMWKHNINKAFFQYKYYTHFHSVSRSDDKKQIVNSETILTLPFTESLKNSIELFEVKDKIEKWESEKYKEFVQAEKFNTIYYWPDYLFIQINRYDSNFHKIQDSMESPLQFNDYTLRGAVIHHGHLRFGHYISILLINGEFFLCDDERIHPIQHTQAIEGIKKAYLLLYVKTS